MAKKQVNLSELRSRAGGKPSQSAEDARTDVSERSAGGSATQAAKKPSRAKTTLIGGHFPPEVRQQLRRIAADEDKTIQQLLGEALNHLFVSYGKPEIADTERHNG